MDNHYDDADHQQKLIDEKNNLLNRLFDQLTYNLGEKLNEK